MSSALIAVPLPALLAELKDGLGRIYGPRLRGVYLFGSHARGEARKGSDLDLVIVLEEVSHYAAEIERTSLLIARLSLLAGVSLSRVFVSEAKLHSARGPFLENAREEAVPA